MLEDNVGVEESEDSSEDAEESEREIGELLLQLLERGSPN